MERRSLLKVSAASSAVLSTGCLRYGVSFGASEAVLDLPDDELYFELRNHAVPGFSFNSEDWVLAKRHDGDWYDIGPRAPQVTGRELPVGESFEWSLRVDNGNEDWIGNVHRADSEVKATGLGPGRYRFRVNSRHHRRMYEAEFEVQGEAPELRGTSHVEKREVEGDTLVLYEREDVEDLRLSVERADEYGDDASEAIFEQVSQSILFRNALPEMESEGFERVVYYASDENLEDHSVQTPYWAETTRVEGEERRLFRYDGRSYMADFSSV